MQLLLCFLQFVAVVLLGFFVVVCVDFDPFSVNVYDFYFFVIYAAFFSFVFVVGAAFDNTFRIYLCCVH